MGKSEFHLKAITENNYKKTTYIYIYFFFKSHLCIAQAKLGDDD